MAYKILLIKRAALGDILMATPLMRQLKQMLPDIQLDFLVSEEFAIVLKNNQYIDNLITLPSARFSLKETFSLIRFALRLRGKYDYVFILDKHYYFNFIGRLISPNTVGYVREPISRLFLTFQVKYDDVMRYHGLYYLDLLQASKLATPDYTDYELDFAVDVSNVHATETIIHEYGFEKNKFVIVINSGGNNKFESGGIRMLPEDKVLQLIERLATSTTVVLLGGKVDEINYNSYLKLVSCQNVINLAGRLTLEQSAVLMRYASKIYTTDCGAMHIAVTQGLYDKLFCFFGPTCPNHVLPPSMGIEYYWTDHDLFDKRYPLYGISLGENNYFTKLNINNLLLQAGGLPVAEF